MLQVSSIVTLALQYAFFTFVLRDAGNLRLTRLSCLVSTIALGRTWPLYLASAFIRVVPLLHQLCLRDVVHLLVLVCHAILLVQVLSERLVVRHSFLTIEKQAVIMLNELGFAVY